MKEALQLIIVVVLIWAGIVFLFHIFDIIDAHIIDITRGSGYR